MEQRKLNDVKIAHMQVRLPIELYRIIRQVAFLFETGRIECLYYMDRHDIKGTTATEVAEAHQKDLEIQDKYGCKALTYWFDEANGTTFCLIEAPRKQAVEQMHHEAHGHVPSEIIEVNPGAVKAFLGRIEDPPMPTKSPAPTSNVPIMSFCLSHYHVHGYGGFHDYNNTPSGTLKPWNSFVLMMPLFAML